jgi:hypothetical protein
VASEDIGLRIVGESGVVGLGLFKLAWPFNRPKLLAPDDIVVEQHSDWKTLEDDV